MPAGAFLALAGIGFFAACATSTSSESPRMQAPATATVRPVASMSELMVDVLYPAGDAVFYIETRTPEDSDGWALVQAQTLMLAEVANLLMMPERARDQDQWMSDARLLLDAGEAAYRAAKDRDVEAMVALNDQLYESCVSCHRHYRAGYGRR